MTRLTIVCFGLIVASALSLVSSQYRARQLFIDLENARTVERRLDVEWRTLQLEQTNFSKHSLIEAAARRDLRMLPASPARTQYITLPSRVDAAAPSSAQPDALSSAPSTSSTPRP